MPGTSPADAPGTSRLDPHLGHADAAAGRARLRCAGLPRPCAFALDSTGIWPIMWAIMWAACVVITLAAGHGRTSRRPEYPAGPHNRRRSCSRTFPARDPAGSRQRGRQARALTGSPQF